MSQVSSGIGFSLTGEFFLFVFSFLLGVITARYLGSQGKGEFGVIYGAANLVTQIFSLRFINSFTYFLAKNRQQIGANIFYSLLIGVCFLPLGTLVFLFPVVYTALFARIEISLWVILLLSYSTYLWSLVNAIFSGLLLFNARAYFMGGSYLLKCVIVVIGLALLRLDLTSLMIFMGITETLAYGLVVFWFLATAKGQRMDFRVFKAMLSYSLKSYPGMLSDLVAHRLDIFIINFFAGASEVGIYTVGLSMANLLLVIPTGAKAVLMPYIARNNDREITAALSRLMVLVMSLIAVILIPLSWVLIGPVYGEEFTFARVLMLILLPGTLFAGVFSIFSSDIEGRGLPGKLSLISLLCGVVSVILYLLLVPALKATGAAIVSSISNILAMLLAAQLVGKILKVKPTSMFFPGMQDWHNLIRIAKLFILRFSRPLARHL